MKKSIRILSFALCALMLCGMLAACNGGAGDSTVDLGANGGVNIGPGGNQGGDHQSTYAPSGNKYDGADFVVLISGKDANTLDIFTYAEENPTVIDTGIQKKNAAVESDYDIKIAETVLDRGSSNGGATKMSNAISSESLDYHLAYIESYSVVPLAYDGVLYDLNSMNKEGINGINLNNEWWDQNANRDLAINDLMFFTTGDIDIWDDMQQFVMIFNRTLFARDIKDYSVDEFYKLVQDGKWTYDMFYEIAKGYTKDLDGAGVLNNEDQWGMITWDDTIYSVFSSCGGQVVKVEEDGSLSLPIFGNELAMDCMRKYTEWTKENAYNYSRDGGGSKAIKMFTGDLALFFMGRLQSLDNYRDMESDFGLTPVPKYSEDQTYNVTCSPYHFNFVCTLSLEEQVDMRAEVIESLAYYSRQYLTPAYREKTLEGQSVRDDGSLETLKITADNRIYDIGFYIKPGDITRELIQLYRLWSTDYASMYAGVKSTAEQAVKSVSDAYRDMIAEWQQ